MGYTHGQKWTLEQVKEEVIKVMNALNLERMPTSTEVRRLKTPGLDGAITRHGGYITIAEKLGVGIKTKWSNWDYMKIKEAIVNAINELKIDRMPTRSELMSIQENNPLHNGIARNGGYEYWANELNLSLKESDSKTGWDAEAIAKVSMETSLGYKVEKMSTKHPYDLLVNDFVKVDVKCARPYYLRGSRVHTFGISKRYSTCDLYIIYALDETDRIEKTFIIPGHKLRIVTMCIGKKTKYDKYLDRWDYFEKYNELYKKIS